jgi:unsaturated chondroitin disaccharide hydrolase
MIKGNSIDRFEEFMEVYIDYNILGLALCDAIKKIEKNLDEFINLFPHVSRHNTYIKEKNRIWTSSFWVGMVYLAYNYTKKEDFLKHSPEYLSSFEERLTSNFIKTHDLGFLYILSSVALYKLKSDEKARILGINAAEKLANRYNSKGKYIEAWRSKDRKVDLMIDTMMNLPLLFWSSEETKNDKFKEIACNHAYTTEKILIRKDGSSYHIGIMDDIAGKLIKAKTFQGRYDESTWSRGQAWALYGFALCYKYTKNKLFLDTSIKTANYFINNVSKDMIPYWDLSFTEEDCELKDSSAASIASCGLLELSNQLGNKGVVYKKAAYKIIRTLYKNYFIHIENNKFNGLIKHGVYHINDGADEQTIWGDYFYLESLVRMNMDWVSFW